MQNDICAEFDTNSFFEGGKLFFAYLKFEFTHVCTSRTCDITANLKANCGPVCNLYKCNLEM